MKTQYDKDCVEQPTPEQLKIVSENRHQFILDTNGDLQEDFDSVLYHKDGITIFIVYKSGRIIVIAPKDDSETAMNIQKDLILEILEEIKKRGGNPVGKGSPERTAKQSEVINAYMNSDNDTWNMLVADANGIDLWGAKFKTMEISKISIIDIEKMTGEN